MPKAAARKTAAAKRATAPRKVAAARKTAVAAAAAAAARVGSPEGSTVTVNTRATGRRNIAVTDFTPPIDFSSVETVDLSNQPESTSVDERSPGSSSGSRTSRYFTRSNNGDSAPASVPGPETHYKLQPTKNVRQYNMRERIKGEYFESFKREFKLSPPPALIDKHIWETEVAGNARIEKQPGVECDVHSFVYDNPTLTVAQLTELTARELGITNQIHVVQLEELISDAVKVRQKIFWLFGGGMGHDNEDLAGWMAEVLEMFIGTRNCRNVDEQEVLLSDTLHLVCERVGLTVSVGHN